MPKIKLKVKEVIQLEREMDLTEDELKDLQEMDPLELDEFAVNLMHGNRDDIQESYGEWAEIEELE